MDVSFAPHLLVRICTFLTRCYACLNLDRLLHIVSFFQVFFQKLLDQLVDGISALGSYFLGT